jgi:phosphatidate cytidylyltransferase
VGFQLWNLSFAWAAMFPVGLLALFMLELRKQETQPFQLISLQISGIFYIGISWLMLAFLVLSGDGSYHGLLMVALLGMIWLNDMGAYAAGRLFGKRPLFPRISPKKTIEGSIGGVLIALGFSIGMYFAFQQKIPLVHWLALGIISAVFATLGDLVESMLKRSLAIKDSGSLIPGHGGMLDRFDAFFVAIPMQSAYFLLIIQPGLSTL